MTLAQIVAQIALAMLEWAVRRMEHGATATDASKDVDSMRRAGARVREWMRQQGGPRP